MSNSDRIDTGGGAFVDGDVQAARDFIGRDQNLYNIVVNLKDIHDAAEVTRLVARTLSTGDLESESIRADLLGLMEELRKTHSTIVKAISPLRRVPDDVTTFARDFGMVYNDFRDLYDAKDFWEERTHCHKLRLILEKLEKHHSPVTQTPAWGALRQNLQMLSSADGDIIEAYYVPFMRRINDVMNKIHQHLAGHELGQAIALKHALLAELAPQYDGIKNKLRSMTELIADIERDLA